MSGRANSRGDIDALARRLAFSPSAAHPALAARIMADGLMLPTQWWLKAFHRFIKWRHALDSFDAWAIMFKVKPEVATDLVGQAADWIARGKDAGGEGLGGFDQREFDRMTALLDSIDGATS